MRGEYRFGSGEVLHNSFTNAGIAGILKGALRNQWPAGGLFVGLCIAVPSRLITLASIVEPTIGVNGYARIPLARSAIGWPVEGTLAGDPYLESLISTFTAVGGNFSQGVTRLFLTPEVSSTVGELWALSAALNAPLIIGPGTPIKQRQFNYRVYGI